MKAYCPTCKIERSIPFAPSDAEKHCPDCGTWLTKRPRAAKPLERRTELRRRRSLTQRSPQRDWTAARAKVEREAECRLSGLGDCAGRLEVAHVIGRDRDQFPIAGREQLWAAAWYVAPERIVPLCSAHHAAFDRGTVELLGRLHPVEELQAVRDSRVAHESGIEAARRRLAPLAYRREQAA